MKTLLESLASIRNALGWTQGKLAESARLSRMTVRDSEAGKTNPHLTSLEAMARAMDMEIIVVPAALREELEMFVRAGGKWLGHPPGVSAPLSIVDEILRQDGGDPSATEFR